MDHVFVLNSIIDIYLQKRKRVYCSFIDYKKAFDLFDSLLLYADDTNVMAETPEKLQVALINNINAVSDYCSLWNLTANTSKTKIIIFSRGKVKRYPDFAFSTEKLDVVDEYVYLGVKFNYNGNYNKMIAKQITQARKALYCMLTKVRKLQLPIDIQCQLFDHLVLPILIYGSEVWSAVAQW